MRRSQRDSGISYWLTCLCIHNNTMYSGTNDSTIWNWNTAGTYRYDEEKAEYVVRKFHGALTMPNDLSSATRPTRALDCNRDAMAGRGGAWLGRGALIGNAE